MRRLQRGQPGGLAVLLLIGATTGGCAAAGFAAAPLMSAVQAVTDRSLERTVPVDQGAALGASLDTLMRMGFRLDRIDRESEPRVIEGSAEGITVVARLSRVTDSMTRLALRVETGGLTADKDTAEAIASQVLARVKNLDARIDADGTARALSTLRHEVQQLRSTLERERASSPVAVAPAAPAPPRPQGFTLGAPAVVVPSSYGFVTPVIPGGTRSHTSGVGGLEPVSPAAVASSASAEIVAVPLTPVSTRAPVSGLTTTSPSR